MNLNLKIFQKRNLHYMKLKEYRMNKTIKYIYEYILNEENNVLIWIVILKIREDPTPSQKRKCNYLTKNLH